MDWAAKIKSLPGAPQERPRDLEGWVAYLNYFIGLGLIAIGVLVFLFESSLINPFSWLHPFFYM